MKFAPADAPAVAALLATCAREGTALVAGGGGTLQSIGNAPTRCDATLSLAQISGIVDYDPRDMTAGILAGTTLAEITRTLAEHGQQLPFDAPHPERATIGGTIAAGWAGPRRGRYGRPRDLLIGSTVALTDGTIAHAGGMVVKNVTGYDMTKAYAGSLGTLAIIVRANVKTLPRAAAHRVAIAPLPHDVAERAVASMGGLTIEPSAALAIAGFDRAAPLPHAPLRLVVFYEGSEALVERATRELRSVLGKAGVPETHLVDGPAAERVFAGVLDASTDADDDSITYRSTGLPTSVWARARAATSIAETFGLTTDTIADLRNGDVVLRAGGVGTTIGDYDAAVRAAIERTTVLAGAPALRAAVDAWGMVPTTIATMRALKARFDPANILAPGRYVGGI